MTDETLIHDLECQEQNTGKLQPKVTFAGDTYVGQPLSIVTEEMAAMVGDRTTAVVVDPEYGVYLSGKLISFSAMPHQLAFGGGYYRLDPRHVACLPSTSPTPLPLFMRSTPPLLRARGALQNEITNNLEPFSDMVSV